MIKGAMCLCRYPRSLMPRPNLLDLRIISGTFSQLC